MGWDAETLLVLHRLKMPFLLPNANTFIFLNSSTQTLKCNDIYMLMWDYMHVFNKYWNNSLVPLFSFHHFSAMSLLYKLYSWTFITNCFIVRECYLFLIPEHETVFKLYFEGFNQFAGEFRELAADRASFICHNLPAPRRIDPRICQH